jgi:hypothetical protein
MPNAIRTLDDLMSVEVHSINDIEEAMKIDNSDYSIDDDVDFSTPKRLEKYKAEWKDYEKFCLRK